MRKKVYIGIIVISLCLVGCGNKEKKEIVNDSIEIVEMTGDDLATGSFDSIEAIYQNKYKICYRSKNMGHPSRGSEYSTDCGWNTDEGSVNYMIDYYINENNIESDYPDYNSLSDVEIADNTFKIIFDATNFTLLYKIDTDIYLRVEVHGSCQFEKEKTEEQEKIVEQYIQNGYFDQVIDFDVIYME